MARPVELVVGILLVLVGAIGATTTQRRLDGAGRATVAPLAIAPFGALLGAGAALVRGVDPLAYLLVGAIAVPVVGAVGRLVEVRRHRRRQQH